MGAGKKGDAANRPETCYNLLILNNVYQIIIVQNGAKSKYSQKKDGTSTRNQGFTRIFNISKWSEPVSFRLSEKDGRDTWGPGKNGTRQALSLRSQGLCHGGFVKTRCPRQTEKME